MATGTATQQLDRIEELLKAFKAEAHADSGYLKLAMDSVSDAATSTFNLLDSYVDAIYQEGVSTNAHLLAIRNAIGTGNITTIISALSAYVDGIETLIGTTNSISGTTNTLMLEDAYTQSQILAALQFLNSTMGAGDGPGFDIIGYLAKIAENTIPESCGCVGAQHKPNECPQAYTSNGVELEPFFIVGGTNIHTAKFPTPPPVGIEFGTFFGLQALNSELVNTTPYGWASWSIYVASRSETFAHSPASLDRFPTNQWISMLGFPATIAIGVEAIYGLTVYLCAPTEETPEVPEGVSGWVGGRQTLYNGANYLIQNDAYTFITLFIMNDVQTRGMSNPLPDHAGATVYFNYCGFTGTKLGGVVKIMGGTGHVIGYDDPVLLTLNPGDRNVPYVVDPAHNLLGVWAPSEGPNSSPSSYYAAVTMSWEISDTLCSEAWDDL